MNLIFPLQRTTRKPVHLHWHGWYRAVLLACLAALGAQAQIYTNIYTFSLHRADPTAPLVQGFDGEMYGAVTESGGFYNGGGGANGGGTVFSLSTGLAPFVKLLPTAGSIGSIVRVLGTDLIGATGVTFAGISAPFKVISASEITATVPDAAATGAVQVTTPSGTLLSNISFQVKQ